MDVFLDSVFYRVVCMSLCQYHKFCFFFTILISLNIYFITLKSGSVILLALFFFFLSRFLGLFGVFCGLILILELFFLLL